MLRSIARLVVMLTAVSVPATAQTAVAECISAGGGTQWPTAAGSSSGPAAIPDSATLGRLLFGRYAILQIITEGVDVPVVRRWFLRVSRPDSADLVRDTDGRLRGQLVALAEREPNMTRGHAQDTSRYAADEGERFELRIQPTTGVLRWYSRFGGNEGSTIFDVREIDSTGFDGRWEDGGIALNFVQRGDARSLERFRGFYCAKRSP